MSVVQTKFCKSILAKASKLGKTIVLPEAEYSNRVLEAGLKCASLGVCNVVLLAKSDKLNKYASEDRVRVVNISTSELKPMLAEALYIKRQHKGISKQDANNLVGNELYFGTMMVDLGLVDGMVAGAENASSDVLRPALQIIKGANPDDIISTVVFVSKGSDTLALADCALNINPSANELCQIAMQTAKSADKLAGLRPRVALLSYSTYGSGKGESVDKVAAAAKLMKGKAKFEYIGEVQADTALDSYVRQVKCANAKFSGDANILIFPNIDSGNIGYKLIKHLAGYTAVGPITQGLKAPVNDISRGANVEEIIQIIAITAIQGE